MLFAGLILKYGQLLEAMKILEYKSTVMQQANALLEVYLSSYEIKFFTSSCVP